ncbi:hypothetical protein J8Z24_18155 [Pseudoalteromonas sp. SCSIO 43201]|uniref:hypothetical protein n=1 Tax=Pseudoalteromonas sp. SCSIO 43201 TaxID=2822842 RepID=UPI0020765466|nr:hypothetical protein [Pseudoalteromonas sp. SCSIO 43201]USD30885.1 hypothetical protein J8Z24_18155 [Pseudoalteromonas sp. SCSIO 43201]
MRDPFQKASRRVLKRLANATIIVNGLAIRVLVQNKIESGDLKLGGFIENQDLKLTAIQNEISNVELREHLNIAKDSGESLVACVMRPPKSDGTGLSSLPLTLDLDNEQSPKPAIRY